MWIWWPVDSTTALHSLRALHNTDIPVLQINQLPTSDAEKLVVAYAGPDDTLRASNAAIMMVETQQAAVAVGMMILRLRLLRLRRGFRLEHGDHLEFIFFLGRGLIVARL